MTLGNGSYDLRDIGAKQLHLQVVNEFWSKNIVARFEGGESVVRRGGLLIMAVRGRRRKALSGEVLAGIGAFAASGRNQDPSLRSG